jgi:hypothetical protein
MRSAIPVIEKVSGVILLVVGFLLVSGSFTMLSAWFAAHTPAWISKRL